jgi:hypothetical protein
MVEAQVASAIEGFGAGAVFRLPECDHHDAVTQEYGGVARDLADRLEPESLAEELRCLDEMGDGQPDVVCSLGPSTDLLAHRNLLYFSFPFV